MCTTKPRPSRAEIDSLADNIAVLSARIDAMTHQLLTAIRRFDEAGGWAAQGARSCAHWLSWRVGIGLVAAREKVRVAHALAKLPLIDAALSRGELSYAKARAMTRVADAGNEDLLLDFARGATGAQLERICASFRTVSRQPIDEDQRFVRRRHNHDDGTISIEMRLLPDEAERIWTALREIKLMLSPNDSAEIAPAPKPSLADAALAMAERALTPGTAPSTAGPTRRQLFVHLREERIAERGSWTAELHDGTPISGESLLRIACDSDLIAAKTDNAGNPLDIVRRRRAWSAKLMRALLLRDRHCRWPGCTLSAFVEAHHLEHWIQGGHTSLENGILLCHPHHVAVHEGGFHAERDEHGALRFFDPDKRIIHPHPPAATVTALEAEPAAIAPRTNLPSWNGSPLDLHAAAGALCNRAARAPRSS